MQPDVHQCGWCFGVEDIPGAEAAYTHADGDGKGLVLEENGGIGHGPADALSEVHHVRSGHSPEQNDELLAAEATGNMAFSDLFPEASGKLVQNGVARHMAVGIVDLLEVVDIRHQKMDSFRRLPESLQRVFGLLEEVTPNGYSCQRVNIGSGELTAAFLKGEAA